MWGISNIFTIFALAFGKKCAMVDTAPLNRQATSTSALPTANSLRLRFASGTPYKKIKNKWCMSTFIVNIEGRLDDK